MLTTSRLRIGRGFMAGTVLLFASELQSQSWVTLPNGELGYITNYTTTGFFQCGEAYAIIGTCQESGNSITLGSGGNFLTLIFQGISQAILVTNTPQRHILGNVTKSFSGPGQFTFPRSRNVNTPLFSLSMALNSTFPVPGALSWQLSYFALSLTNIPCNNCDYAPQTGYATSPPPAGYGYGAVSWESIQGAGINVFPAPMQLSATAAITPEPATLVLTVTGCLGLIPTLLRKRRRNAKQK